MVESPRTVLITGGSSGIGKATALAFAHQGERVVVGSRNRRRGMEVVRQIELVDGEAFFVPCDVTRVRDVESLVEQTVDLYGSLDVAVNAAAVTDPVLARTAELSEEEFDQMLSVTLKGVWLCMRAEIPAMLESGGGAIVNIGSANGLHGMPMASHYAAAKDGVLGLTKTAALEYAREGIRVNSVCPGPTDTPLLERMVKVVEGEGPGATEAYARRAPLGRVARPDEVAKAIVWLASDDASYVTGSRLSVDGGMSAGFAPPSSPW